MKRKRDSAASADEQSSTDQEVPEVPANLEKLQSQLGALVSKDGNEQKKIADDRTDPAGGLTR